ncbi:MAG: hypothetical protein H6Q61_315 [Firmicutes bacterium]|nr:hypothetical protein [Bacillota bacterium]
MSDHMFLCIQKINQSDQGGSNLLCFPGAVEADAHIRDWLEKACGMECYRGPVEEARLKEENGGELPELAFACPEVYSPSDLERYNGYYSYGSVGTFHLFVMAIYDEATARRFMGEAIREFDLNKVLSDEADEMIEMLEILRDSFLGTADYHMALEKVGVLIRENGLPLF